MLRGLKSPGPAFEWSSSENRFNISREIYLPEMSSTALTGLLQHFADLGTIAVKYVLVAHLTVRLLKQAHNLLGLCIAG